MNPGDISELKYRYYEAAFDALPNFDALKPTATGTLTPAYLDLKPRRRDENFGFVYEGFPKHSQRRRLYFLPRYGRRFAPDY